jgi:hypothetical protein
MSLPLTPFERWLSGTNQNSIPANNNSLRSEIFNTDGIADDVTAQPGSPSDGDWYIIPSGATGAQWSTFAEDSVAIFYGGLWYEFVPAQGNKVSIAGVLVIYDETDGWEPITLPAAAPVHIGVAVSDETTDLTTGAAKTTFRSPLDFTLGSVRASLTAPQPSGSIFTVDINKNGTTILSTKLTIDNGEETSVTAATPPVISDDDISSDDEITIDIDQVGDAGAKGLKVWLIGMPA